MPVSGVVIQRVTLRRRPTSSTAPSSRNGVTIGVKTPRKRFIPSIVQALDHFPVGQFTTLRPSAFQSTGGRSTEDVTPCTRGACA